MKTTQSIQSLFVATGLMLFALFFGAGNLIFPANMGQLVGDKLLPAILGFVTTGAGLPLLGIVAMAYSGTKDVQTLASRVSPTFGLLFAIALYLSIGPLFAMPRTATVSFEIGVVPFLGESWSKEWALALFSVVFFAIAYWLAMSPGKLIDRIGKVLTPVLLLSIAILTITSFIQPMGDLQAAQQSYQTHPFIQGFVDGYQTMDALASLVFAIIVIEALQQAGVTQVEPLLRMTIGAGLLAAVCLGIVYAMVTYMGASSVAQIGILNNGAAVLSQVAAFYWGTAGNVLLLVIVLLACLSTSVGLIAACSEYFHRIYPRLSYRGFAILFTLISCVLANKGLSGIIQFSVPVLVLLYPLTMVIILLSFLHSLFKGHKLVYQVTMGLTLIVGILEGWKTAFGLPSTMLDYLNTYLSWYDIGMGWVMPAVVGFVVSVAIVHLQSHMLNNTK
ncbi:branched-chain amino acid transport system II carrier protein [Pelistega europaea]|uniref:Branched-chain amino acid transport system carrier protein n=1 Tax=Pelistega europaea TaxID=106147 RepID=A0A7Y4LA44_9BURK|nr:branched-chain amino acid transport system II carrier protein [Pelistega europaea]NOL48726.1 branched-chain amino acid transport system II carrier protein [Pelistega europaea]